MISIGIAGLSIGIDERFDYIRALTEKYRTDSPCDFTVRASDEDIAEERAGSDMEHSDGYLESISVYRNIAERLPDYSAAVFHGAVIAYGGVAYAVTARSGTGKTTHLRLWLREFGDKVHILNGDKPILRIIDGKVWAAGTPWRGKEGYGVNEMLPLGGIAFLERAENNSCESLSASAATVPFVSQLYIPKSPSSAAKALILTNKIITTVPLFRLGVNMEPEAAHVAFRALVGERKI